MFRAFTLIASLTLALTNTVGCHPSWTPPPSIVARPAPEPRRPPRTNVTSNGFPVRPPVGLFEVRVHPVGHVGGQIVGATETTRISVRPSRGRATVSVAEEYSGGAGGSLRASVWVATSTAAALVGRSVNDYEVQVVFRSHLDGASAGALLTAGIAAAMARISVRPHVTITGTVSSYGLVGDVGGLGGKLRAAMATGKTIFGYPHGLRQITNRTSGLREELDDIADDAGGVGADTVKLVPLENIYQAFSLLTGKQLPRPKALNVAALRFDAKTRGILAQLARKRLASARALLPALSTHATTPDEHKRGLRAKATTALQAAHSQARALLKRATQLLSREAHAQALIVASDALALVQAMKFVDRSIRGKRGKTLAAALHELAQIDPRPYARPVLKSMVLSTGSIAPAATALARYLHGGYHLRQARRLLVRSGSEQTKSSASAATKPVQSDKRRALRSAGIAAVIRSLAAFYGLRGLAPILSPGAKDYMIDEKPLKRASRCLAVDAEARLTYARARLTQANATKSQRTRDLQRLRSCEYALHRAEAVDQRQQAFASDVYVIGAARACLLKTQRLLDRIDARRSTAGAPGQSSRSWACRRYDVLHQLLRSHAAAAAQAVGTVPAAVKFRAQLAAELRQSHQCLAACAHLDAAITDSRLALHLRPTE